MIAVSRARHLPGVAVSAALILVVVAGCGSSPRTRFYTLNPVAPTTRMSVSNRPPLKISAVHIPGVLDRNSIIRSETNYQLGISSQERWGADLGQMIRRTLTQDLQQRLPDGMVIPPQSPAPDSARGLVVDILSFGPDASGQLELEATWTLLAGSPARVMLQRTAHLTESAVQPAARESSSSASAQAAAMSALLARLADDIASGHSQLREARE